MNRPYRFAGVSELILELRIDHIREPDLERIFSHKRGKVIATNRRREEGGRFAGTEEERVRSLRQAAALGADYVDIEASTDGKLISALKREIVDTESGAKLIVSHHDFQRTVPESSLREKMEMCGEWSPAIVKIATMARSMEDNLHILRLIPHARRKGVKIIAFCMGSAGRISRVMSPLLGAYLFFAAANRNEATAPGQMHVQEMLRVLGILGHQGETSGVGWRQGE
jgi:3-dehydroquinate dehydratase type I